VCVRERENRARNREEVSRVAAGGGKKRRENGNDHIWVAWQISLIQKYLIGLSAV
jgi:hypothetical protein